MNEMWTAGDASQSMPGQIRAQTGGMGAAGWTVSGRVDEAMQIDFFFQKRPFLQQSSSFFGNKIYEETFIKDKN